MSNNISRRAALRMGAGGGLFASIKKALGPVSSKSSASLISRKRGVFEKIKEIPGIGKLDKYDIIDVFTDFHGGGWGHSTEIEKRLHENRFSVYVRSMKSWSESTRCLVQRDIDFHRRDEFEKFKKRFGITDDT